MPDAPSSDPNSGPAIAPGELLKVCAEASKAPELEQKLIEGSARFCQHHREEFRLALTALLRADAKARDELFLLAKKALAKVQKVRRTVKTRTWGKEAEGKKKTNPDPYLETATQKELDAIRQDYQQEMAMVLQSLQQSADEIVRQFSGTHLHVAANARAIVEQQVGFELREPGSNSDDVMG